MRMERAIWLLPDGSIQCTKLSDEFRLNLRTFPQTLDWDTYVKFSLDKEAPAVRLGRLADEDNAAYLARMDAMPDKGFGKVVSFIPEDEFQKTFHQHRMFRDGWTWTTPEPIIDFDMAKCRNILRRAAAKTGVILDNSIIENARTPNQLPKL